MLEDHTDSPEGLDHEVADSKLTVHQDLEDRRLNATHRNFGVGLEGQGLCGIQAKEPV